MAASENARIQRLINSAEELVQKGERQKALTELHKVLDIDSGNGSVKKRISEIEREIAAMRNFRKTRNSRTHKTGKSVSSGDFVEECIARSEDAFRQGDEVRALQELERARRHDPDNKLVRRKIIVVRRQIKTDNLYDLALAKLHEGDPVTATKNARAIFKTWPGAPVLSDLLDKLEEFKPAEADEHVEEIEDIEDIELEDVVEAEEGTAPVPEKEKTSPADAAIISIRGKISRSDFSSALTEATKARKSHPENKTIKELLSRLEKLSGKKSGKPAVAPVAKADELKETPEKKKPVALIAAVLVAIILIVVFVVVKPFAGEPEAVPVEEDEVLHPYSVSYTVDGVETYSVAVDGEAVNVLLDGSFLIEGTSEGVRTIEVRSSGFETYREDVLFESGEKSTLSITLDSIGTSTVQVVLQAVGVDDGEVAWLVDGAESENSIDLLTGVHVFQAVLEGFNSLPESILVDYSAEALQISLTLYSQEESQVTLALAGDIPGSALFFIDGNRVGAGVRRISEVLPFGTYLLRVEVENHESWARTVTLDSGGYSATVSPVEIVTTGRLLIAPEPWANVTIDGVGMGQTPMAPIELEEGSHTVLLTSPDYEDQTSTVTITAGEDASVRYTAAEAQPDQPEEIVEEQPVIPPFPISQVGPQVPGLASDMGDVHGYVTLDVLVGTDGSVLDVTIVNDELGLGCGAAAEAAVSQWVFNPASQGGAPIEITTRVQVRFDVD
ncbi:MAG: PEGA domain-containing protein [Candidatus Sabulitectum sp.]|nr:PEGA domain-containing protein [Candidatus Sabulitectum sp.]